MVTSNNNRARVDNVVVSTSISCCTVMLTCLSSHTCMLSKNTTMKHIEEPLDGIKELQVDFYRRIQIRRARIACCDRLCCLIVETGLSALSLLGPIAQTDGYLIQDASSISII